VPDYTDVEIRLLAPIAASAGQPLRCPVEVRVERSGLWKGESVFDFNSLDPIDPEVYGKALGKQLSSPSLLRALDQAGMTRGTSLRIRLLLDDDSRVPHWVRWERVWFPFAGADWRVAVNPKTPFCRYIPVELPDEEPPETPFFRLVFAVANPAGLKPLQTINVEREIGSLVSEFESGPLDRRLQVSVLPGRTGISDDLKTRLTALGWELLTGNTTLETISEYLHRGFHGLHLLGHGDFNPDSNTGSLLLEKGDGGLHQVQDTELQSWVTHDLQLIVFQACLSAGAPAQGGTPFTGVAPLLIRLGVPAAIAMQDFVEMNDARAFFAEFYRGLLDNGLVDVAVNCGRQRLIHDASRDNWSIPALFTRFRGGRLWRSDELRDALKRAADELPEDAKRAWPPLKVVEHTRGLAGYDRINGAAGPRFDMWKRLWECIRTPGSRTILTGSRGSSKGTQIGRLFRQASREFLSATPGAPLPVMLDLTELAGSGQSRWAILQRIWKGIEGTDDKNRVSGREFLFLISCETDMAGNERQDAIAAMLRLADLPGSRLVLVADESLLDALSPDLNAATLLVIEPLESSQIISYLDSLGTEQATELRQRVETSGLADLASQPRFLQQMIDLAARGQRPQSRRAILEAVATQYLNRVDTRRIPRSSAEQALQCVAWEIQTGRGGELPVSRYFQILAAARGGRDFTLSDLKDALEQDRWLLVSSGEEGIRFAYPSLQSYFAARKLVSSPDRTMLLEDITASLGRLARLRRWENVLVLLGSLWPAPGDLLRTILAGSNLTVGEQLYLAVHCYQEMVAHGSSSSDVDDEVDQMADTLMWRSSWDLRTPYADRVKALDALIELTVICPSRRVDVVPYLVGLAFDPVTKGESEQFDWAGIRQRAAIGLLRIFDATERYVMEKRPDLAELLAAWKQLPQASAGMLTLLKRDDPRCSVLACYALVQTGRDDDRHAILDAYEHSANREVKWAIVDALSAVSADWVSANLLEPWVAWSGAVDLLRQQQTCYLIEKANLANSAAREYLSRCLLEESPSLQGHALRAFGKLQDNSVEAWLRPLCEFIVAGGEEAPPPDRIRLPVGQPPDAGLMRFAMETLRTIGDGGSIDKLRRGRSKLTGANELRPLSFEVAEQIYWRITGGLTRETYTSATSQT
jgi:hypothetical protein